MENPAQKTGSPLDNFLSQFGKTISQARLYPISHPLVSQSIQNSFSSLSQFLEQNAEITITYVDKMYLVNGVNSASLSSIASTLHTLFEKYSLQSLSFLKEISSAEYNSFLKILSNPKEVADLKTALEKETVQHISLNSAIYAKVGEGGGDGKGDGSGGGAGSGTTAEAEQSPKKPKEWFDNLQEMPLEANLREIVKKSVPDSDTQKKIYELILKQINSEMETYVKKATRDIQQEKDVLVSEQAKTKSVISQLSTGSIMVNEKGEIVMVNEGAERILGVPLAELKGKTLEQIARQELMISLAKEIAPTVEESAPQVTVLAQELTQHIIQNSTAMIQNPEGKVVGMISVLQDIAKLRELQRIQDDFMSHVTHELRSPLTAIKAALGAAQEGTNKDPQQEQVLTIAGRNVDRLARLINDLLDVSKIGGGKMTVNPRAVSSEILIRDAAQSLESWAKIKQIQLAFEPKGKMPYILADADRTTQILVNLISNAIKFTPANGTIRVHASPPGATYLKVNVTDSGPGMTQQEQQHLFERFFQAKKLTKSDSPGTGLGLYIAKTLVELQKGQIGCESEKGKGTTFYFTIPITQEPEKPTPLQPQQKNPIIKNTNWLTRFFKK